LHTITSEEMAVADANSEFMGVSRLVLMENAGRVVASHVERVLGGLAGRRVLVLAGPGNNGGDGMAAARHIAVKGGRVTVLLLASPDRIRTAEARANYMSVRNMRLTVAVEVAETSEELLKHSSLFDEAELIVDAILGTGAKAGLSGVYKTAVELANNSKAFRLSIDIPTGLEPDTGEGGFFFNADLTIALHKPKPVHGKLEGKTVVEEIGMPSEAEVVAGPGQLMLMVRKLGRERIYSGRLAYVFGAEGPDQRVRTFLNSLKGVTTFCDLNGMVENPELRYAVAASRAVLLSNDVSPASIRPFLPRSQPVVVNNLATSGVNPVYVLWSDKPLTGKLSQEYQTLVKDVEELCRKLAAPVYIVGETDTISNGLRTYLNWLGRSVKPPYFGYVSAAVAWFLGAGADPLLAMASTSHLLRNVDPPLLENPSELAEYFHRAIDQLV
jgi:hydroxyethylthiazole kinase-like uncharacterized protein yjeF